MADSLEFFDTPDMREKFFPLDPETVVHALYVFVYATENPRVNAIRSQAGEEDDIAEVVGIGQESLGFSDPEAEVLRNFMGSVLADEELRPKVFKLFLPDLFN